MRGWWTMTMHGERKLRQIAMPVLAQPMLQYLRDEGVDARLDSDDAGGLNPALAFVHGVWLVVPGDQVDRATMLLERFDRSLTLIDESFPGDDELEDDLPVYRPPPLRKAPKA